MQTDSLASKDRLNNIISSIEYSDGFVFNIIYAESTKDYALLDNIKQRLIEVEEKKAFVSIFQKNETVLSTLTKELDIFFTTTTKNLKSNTLLILDMRFLSLIKEFEIEMLFSKLNQLRNNFAHLNYPLLFIFPFPLKEKFVASAPDFYSICSIEASIIPETKQKERVTLKKETLKGSLLEKEESKLLNEYCKLKEKNLQWELMAKGNEIGNFYAKHQSLYDAMRYYKLSLALAQAIKEKRPESIEAMRDVSVSYYKLGDCFRNIDSDKSLKMYRSSIEIAEKYKGYLDFENICRVLWSEINNFK